MGSWLSLRPMLALPLMPTMATTATPDTTVDTVDTMVDTTVVDTDTDMADISARGPLMPNPKLMPPLMPGMATTATPDTTVMAVDTTVWDTPAVITVMVDTTDTPTDMVATDISARGPLMPNPKLMLMPAPMPGMATTDMATADTTDTVDTPTVMVDTMVDTGVKLVNS